MCEYNNYYYIVMCVYIITDLIKVALLPVLGISANTAVNGGG